jgi:replicative DNA helicase
MLSDLRESGSIEQDADMVWFIFREEYYHDAVKPETPDERSAPDAVAKYNEWEQRHMQVVNKAAVIIAKQRHGSTGILQLRFESEFTKFSDLARHEMENISYE